MSFMITREVWNGRHYRIGKPGPEGSIRYADAARLFGYSVNRIAHLVSDGRVDGGGGWVNLLSIARWADGRSDKLKQVRPAA